jgi:hypothetical protein
MLNKNKPGNIHPLCIDYFIYRRTEKDGGLQATPPSKCSELHCAADTKQQHPHTPEAVATLHQTLQSTVLLAPVNQNPQPPSNPPQTHGTNNQNSFED